MTDRAAIVGIGVVAPGRYPARTEVELAVEAARAALLDAGLGPDRIGGIFATPDLRGSSGLQINRLCELLRMRPRIAAETSCGALAAGLALRAAVNEIRLGTVDVALCYGAEREASTGWFERLGTADGPPVFADTAAPFATPGTLWAYALSARRYMHETGATEEDFARAVVRDRASAAGNPEAACSEPVDLDRVLRSPPLATPIKLLDAPVALDGAAALVVASERAAGRLAAEPVFVESIEQAYDDSSFVPTGDPTKSITRFPTTREAAERALRAADLTLDEVDVAEIYAPFSPHELMIPEAIGFFEPGGMIAALQNGETGPGGRLPINTDGGLLGRGHPWTVTPFLETIAIVRQLRGEMGKNQVESARVGLMHCEAGMLNDALVAILRRPS